VVKGCAEKGGKEEEERDSGKVVEVEVEVEVEAKATLANMLTNGLPFRGASHGCRAVRADRCS